MGLDGVVLFRSEPATYAARRAATIEELRTGELLPLPAEPYRKLTEAQKKAERLIIRKLYLRKARAEAGRAEELLSGRASLPPQLRDEISKLLMAARHSECVYVRDCTTFSDANLRTGYEGCCMLDMSDKASSKEMQEFVEKVDRLIAPSSA